MSISLLCVCTVVAIVTSGITETGSAVPETVARGGQPKQKPDGSSVRHEPAALDQTESAARQAMDRADTLRSNWTKASLQEAIQLYEKAALIWTSASDFASASQATLNSADVYFGLNEYREALKQYQNAEALAGKTGNWLVKAIALSRMGRLQSFIGKNELAQQQLYKALDLLKQHESNQSQTDANAHGEALTNLAEVSYARGDFVRARELLRSALGILRNDPKGEAKVHLFNGYITGSIGDPEKAVTEISRALELFREVNDKIGEGLALTTLGLSRSLKRDVNGATQLHREAIDIFRVVGDRHSEAIALNSLGQVYEGINHHSLAIHYYEQAVQLFEEIGSKDGMSVTTCVLARTHNLNQQPAQALVLYERCLQLSRETGKVRTEANALTEISKVYASQGRPELALQQYQKIQKLYVAIGDLQGQATNLNAYADFSLHLGENKRALEVCRRAVPLSEKAGDKGIVVSALFNLARANLAVGSFEVALSSIRQSLAIIEDLRANVASPDFRLSYLSGFRRNYELCIEILMQLERRRPGQGFATEALLVSEQARARLLRDLISESQASLRQVAATPLLARERELRELFRRQAQYRFELSLTEKGSAEIAAVDKQLAELRAEYQKVEAELRQQNPRLFSPGGSSALTLQEIQDQLRDDNTMLLEYALGDERSYVWAVTSNSIQSYQLPARRIIEGAARELYRLITARQGTDGPVDKGYQASVEAADDGYPEKAMSLSQMLMGPVAEQIGSKRLLLVVEGALQHIPFDALPLPVSQGISRGTATLIETNEVVVSPSVSALIAIRAGRTATNSPKKLVAIIADPVFSRNDDRVQTKPVSPRIALATSDNKSDQSLPQNQALNSGLARLTHAAAEADAILSVAPWGTTFMVKGFAANRETAMRPDVGDYQILHFATHGVLDSEYPELSGILLSSVDHNGEPTNGLMPLHDIYSLDLSAELTVLSACQTALGKDIKGEGLIGLTHSFMSAGAKSVVASLWKVDDRATAILMTDFYQSMFELGMSPSAALRSAKLRMMRDPHWNAPYYWAGFVLQGEYENRITVERRSSLRLSLVVLLSLVVVVVFIFSKRLRRFAPPHSS